jgi:tRNA(fMet)-specific endonuclease VapC
MGLILDSSVLIAAERGRLRFAEFCSAQGDEELFIAAITASELLHGVERAGTPSIREKRAAWVEAMLAQLPVMEFDLEVARHHARLWAGLASNDLMIGPYDLQIAATARSRGFAVATLNLAEFARVPDLRLATLEAYLAGE